MVTQVRPWLFIKHLVTHFLFSWRAFSHGARTTIINNRVTFIIQCFPRIGLQDFIILYEGNCLNRAALKGWTNKMIYCSFLSYIKTLLWRKEFQSLPLPHYFQNCLSLPLEGVKRTFENLQGSLKTWFYIMIVFVSTLIFFCKYFHCEFTFDCLLNFYCL